jgi:hypothetical protein
MSLTCPVGKFSALQFAGTTHRLILPGNSCKQRASCLERSQIVQHAVPKPGPFCLFTRVCRDRCSSIWDDAEFRLTFALLFYRIALFHSRSDHVRIMNVLLRGMVRALQIDIGPPPPSFPCMKTCTSRSLSCFCPHAVAVAAWRRPTPLAGGLDGRAAGAGGLRN